MTDYLLHSRVRNAGKFGKAKRGGGRHFSRDLSRLDADGNPEGGDKNASSDESSSEESSSEEDIQQRVGQLPPIDQSDEEDNIPGLARNLNSTLSTVAREPVDPDAAPAVSNSRLSARTAESIAQARKERKAAQGTKKAPNAAGGSKAKGSDDESSAEENENQQKNKMMKASDLGAPREMSRREKEQADKIAAKERYAKLHAAGKTDEAKADLGRLAEVRKQRELAANQRKAEAEAREVSHKAAMEKSGKKQALKR